MTYQLMRVEAEMYKKGDVLSGASNVAWHNGKANSLCVWLSMTGDMNNVSTITRTRIEFFGNAVFLRLAPFGLEYDGVTNGDLDHLLTIHPIPEVLGEAVDQIVSVAVKNSATREDGRTIVFIAVLDLTNDKCTFKGVLPLDSMLDCAIVQ